MFLVAFLYFYFISKLSLKGSILVFPGEQFKQFPVSPFEDWKKNKGHIFVLLFIGTISKY